MSIYICVCVFDFKPFQKDSVDESEHIVPPMVYHHQSKVLIFQVKHDVFFLLFSQSFPVFQWFLGDNYKVVPHS